MEILGHIVTGPTVQPVPSTTNEWLIKISADILMTNDKIDRLIAGALTFDGRLDKVESWRERISDDVEKLPTMLDWQQAMDTRLAGLKLSATFLAGVIGAVCGVIGAVVAILTGVAQALGGRHP